MRRISISLIFLLLPFTASAGNCLGVSGPNVVLGDANATLSDKTLCGSSGGDKWQEWHQSNGTLTEYARGPGHAVDPTHDVGTWSTSGGEITYTYNGGDTYTFEYWVEKGGTIFFPIIVSHAICEAGPGTAVVANIDALFPGQGACP